LTNKQIISSLLRELEVFKEETSKVIRDLTLEVNVLKEKLAQYESPKNSKNSSVPPKEEKLAFALEKHKHLFLKFIAIPLVPFDNNQAERDLGMIKVKQKVSGCFRQPEYAQIFARIRCYITTLKKNNQNILINIQNAFDNKPFLPKLAE